MTKRETKETKELKDLILKLYKLIEKTYKQQPKKRTSNKDIVIHY